MFIVYVLKSIPAQRLYVGFTENLRERLKRHNAGNVISTKAYCPWKLIFFECYANKADAYRRERYFKTTPGKKALKLMLRVTLREKSETLSSVLSS